MKCPHCQTENEQNAIFCKNCNAWILASVYVEEPETVLQEECAQDPKPKRKKWLIPAIAVVVAMVVLATVLLWPHLAPSTSMPVVTVPPAIDFQPKQYVQCEGYITHVQNGDHLSILMDDKVLDTQHPFDTFQSLTVNLDGTAAILLAENGILSYICEDGITQLSGDVIRCVLSVNGDGVAYMTGDGDLWLYRHSTGQPELVVQTTLGIADESSSEILIKRPITVSQSFVISPDGASVACLIQNDVFLPSSALVPYILHRYQDGTLVKMESDLTCYLSTELLSISDEGCVYLLNADTLHAIDPAGTQTELGHPGSRTVLVYLNADHTQLIYHANDSTFLSVNGQPGTAISEDYLNPIAPALCNAFQSGYYTVTCPHASFLDQVYLSLSSDSMFDSSLTRSLHHIDAHGGDMVLASGISSAYWTASGNTVFYTHADKLLRVDLPTGTITTIASQVRNFIVSNDGKNLYYVSVNGTLYTCDPADGSDARPICEAKTGYLQTTQYGDVCWTNLSDYLDILPSGQSEVQSMTDLERVIFGANGSLYIFDDTGLHIRTADGWDTLGQYAPPPILYG